MRPSSPKRNASLIYQLSRNDAMYLVLGIDMFDEVDYSTIKKKWEINRGVIMALWDKYEPFTLCGYKVDKNRPGSKPWAWKEFEKTKKKI